MSDNLAPYRTSVELRLEFELQQARTALEHAKSDLEISEATGSGNAREEYQRVLQRYSRAVNRFAEFILNGTIPRE